MTNTAPTVSYRGYDIRWSENADEWSCLSAGRNVCGQSLRKVKEQIDRINLAERKAAGHPCIEIGTPNHEDSYDSQIVQFISTHWKHRSIYDTTGKREIDYHRVATVAKRPGKSKKTRSEQHLDRLAPDTLEARQAIKLFQRFYTIAKIACEIRDLAHKAIPRVQIEDIQPLVEIAENEKEE